jgi:hypothetical protein
MPKPDSVEVALEAQAALDPHDYIPIADLTTDPRTTRFFPGKGSVQWY